MVARAIATLITTDSTQKGPEIIGALCFCDRSTYFFSAAFFGAAFLAAAFFGAAFLAAAFFGAAFFTVFFAAVRRALRLLGRVLPALPFLRLPFFDFLSPFPM